MVLRYTGEDLIGLRDRPKARPQRTPGRRRGSRAGQGDYLRGTAARSTPLGARDRRKRLLGFVILEPLRERQAYLLMVREPSRISNPFSRFRKLIPRREEFSFSATTPGTSLI